MSAPARTPENDAKLDRLRTDYDAWLATCYRIKSKPPQQQVIPLKPWPGQVMLAQTFAAMLREQRRVRIYVLKGRQGGITSWMQARNLHACWRRVGTRAITVSHTKDKTEEIFEITRHAIDHFPRPLLPTLGPATKREVRFVGLDSRFYVETAGDEGKALRGATVGHFHGSEYAFWQNPDRTRAAVTPSLNAPGTVGVLETTANMYDSEGHQFWRKSAKGLTGYRTLFIPWWLCDPGYRDPVPESEAILDTTSPDERDLMRRHGLDLEQIAWRRRNAQEMGLEFFREYAEDAETAWLLGGSLFYDTALLRAVSDLAEDHPPKWIDPNTGIHWWITGELRRALDPYAHVYARRPGQEPERAIIGVDTAEGGAQDASAFVIRTFPRWRKLARFASSQIIPEALADLLVPIARALGGALLVIEKNGHGITVLRRILDHHGYDPALVYHRVSAESVRGPESRPPDRIGWATTEASKPRLLDAGRHLLQMAAARECDPPSIAACRNAYSIARDREGRIDLNGRDDWVAETLAFIGRGYPVATGKTFRVGT